MTTKEWKKALTDEWLRQPGVKETYGVDPDKTFDEQFSAVSVESLLFYAQAFGMMVLEKLTNDGFAILKEQFERLRPHTLSWYAEKIKSYQHDYTLPIDSDIYSVIDEDAKVVKYCSLTERNGVLSAKIAGQENGKPKHLSSDIVAKVAEYINRVKDAGVRILLSSGDADKFSCSLLIHYDPLKNLTTAIIERVIITYLESMPFDGVYSNMALIDVIQKIDGVRVAEVIWSRAGYGDNSPQDITSIYSPTSGYMQLQQVVINLKPY